MNLDCPFVYFLMCRFGSSRSSFVYRPPPPPPDRHSFNLRFVENTKVSNESTRENVRRLPMYFTPRDSMAFSTLVLCPDISFTCKNPIIHPSLWISRGRGLI